MHISKITRVILAVILTTTATVTAAESLFVTVKLPHGFTVDIPKNWWIIGKDLQRNLDTSVQAVMDLTKVDVGEGSEANLIAANSMPKSTYASVRVDVSTPADENPSTIQQLTPGELSALGQETLPGLRKVADLQGNTVLAFYGVTKGDVGGHPSLSTRWKRSGQQGAVIVEILQVFLPKKTFRVNLAYRESEQVIWKPIIQRIKASIAISE